MDRDHFELEKMRWAPRSSPSKGPRRLCKFCFLAVAFPIAILCIPLYMRFLALKPQSLFLSPSDMKVLNQESVVSTSWCQSQILRMNSSFHAYLFKEKPKITAEKQRVKIHKEMIVKDDLKKYWGFYLLRGSTVRLGGCARWPGASVVVVEGRTDARRCAWIGELDSQEESDEFSNELDDAKNVMEDETFFKDDLKKYIEELQQLTTTIALGALHEIEGETTTPLPDISGIVQQLNDLSSAERDSILRQLKTGRKTQEQPPSRAKREISKEDAFNSIEDSKDEDKDNGENEDGDESGDENEDEADDDVENSGGEVFDDDDDLFQSRRITNGHLAKSRVSVKTNKTSDILEERRVVDQTNKVPDHLAESGVFDQTNKADGGKIDNSNEEVRSSDSSSEEVLRNCHGVITVHEFMPQKKCDSSKGPVDESALEWFPFNENSTESQLIHINHTGFYYFIYSNENEMTDNMVVTDIEMQKTRFNTSTSEEMCWNSTDCQLDLTFWSNQHILVEVPDFDIGDADCASVGQNNFEQCNYVVLAESECKPRGTVYMVFLLLLPVIILIFASI